MKTLDLKKELKYLYAPSAKKIEILKVPKIQFAMIDGAIEKGKERIVDHINILRHDRKQIPISVSASPLKDEKGNIVGYGALIDKLNLLIPIPETPCNGERLKQSLVLS